MNFLINNLIDLEGFVVTVLQKHLFFRLRPILLEDMAISNIFISKMG